MSRARSSTGNGPNLRFAASQRKRGEEDKRASDLHFREIVDGIPALIAVMNAAGEMEVVNHQDLECVCKTLEELKSWTTGAAIRPDDLPSLVSACGRLFETGDSFESQDRQRRRLLRPDADNDVMIGPEWWGKSRAA